MLREILRKLKIRSSQKKRGLIRKLSSSSRRQKKCGKNSKRRKQRESKPSKKQKQGERLPKQQKKWTKKINEPSYWQKLKRLKLQLKRSNKRKKNF